jgi:hypothetical protein
MRKKDITVLFFVAVVSGVLSIILSGMIFSKPADRKQKAEVVDSISTTFERPDSTYFNSNSVNPAQDIQIGKDPNSNPFGGR